MNSPRSMAAEHSVKNSIIRKTVQIGGSTLLSRVFGLVREFLLVRYLGPQNPLSDAFITAFKLPNSLRKVFAEGAMSAAFIPTVVGLLQKESKDAVSRLMTLSFLVIQGILIGLCLLIFFNAESVVRFIMPGWYVVPGALKTSSTVPFVGWILEYIVPAWYILSPPVAQAAMTVPLLRLLISFIVLLSSSALLTGALQAMNHFFVPAIAPVVLNGAFIMGIVACLWAGYPIEVLCYAILLGGLIQFLMHFYMYTKFSFSWGMPDVNTWQSFKTVLHKFFPCFLSMSIMEINFVVSTSLASYLPKGSISLVYYANRFMGIPLGVFAVAFSTILLPYFSRMDKSDKSQFAFYIGEAAKLIFWVTMPVALIMSLIAKNIFITLFLSDNFTLELIGQAAHILIIFLSGLFFFSLNKILLNAYYAFHDTRTPLYISCIAALLNCGLSIVMLKFWGIYGLTGAFVLVGILQSVAYVLLLPKRLEVPLDYEDFFRFVRNAGMQLFVAVALFAGLYYGIRALYMWWCSPALYAWFMNSMIYWLWVGPLLGMVYLFLHTTRAFFGVKGHFFE